MGLVLWSSVIISVVAMVSTTSACSCLPASTLQLFCKAKTSVLADITSDVSTPVGGDSDVTYPMAVVKHLKGGKRRLDEVITAENSALCGVTFTTGLYVLSGTAENTGLRVGLCDLHIREDRLQYWERVLLNSAFLHRAMCWFVR